MRVRTTIVILLVVALLGGAVTAYAAPPDGTLAIGVHVTLVSRWLDPGETEALITPFMVLYLLHDALVKPMPGGIMTPSLAESWSLAKDGVTYEFVIRKNAKFHNGDPVTAEDVKFTFERYKGASAGLLREKVKEIQTPAPNRVRIILKEPWPDFMAFYGTSATGASWIVPKKYIEKVGEDAYKKAPVGAGPYKLITFNPGIELVTEAFPDYWRKAPSVKRVIMRSIPDETTRAAAVKSGEVDMAFLFGGPVAEDLKRSPGMRIQAPLLYGVYWLDFLDQWDPKSPWHDKRVRQAASLAIDRNAINQAEMLGLGKATSAFVPPEFEFSMKFETTPFDPKRAKQLLAEAGYANGLDAGDITPLPPYTTVGETVSGMLQAVGIKSRVRTMERATFLTTWREKKLRGLLIGATGAAGNAETRIEPFFTKSGFYAYGSLPQIDELFQSQARETDRKRREAQLHQIQQIVHDQVLAAPIFQQAFLCAVGARVAESGLGLIQGFPYAGPAEELRLK